MFFIFYYRHSSKDVTSHRHRHRNRGIDIHIPLLLFSYQVMSDSVTPWIETCQAPVSSTISQSWLKFMSPELLMLSNHLILGCSSLLCLQSFPAPGSFPMSWVFSNELALHSRWSKYWQFSFRYRPSSEYSGLISFRINWFDLLTANGIL